MVDRVAGYVVGKQGVGACLRGGAGCGRLEAVPVCVAGMGNEAFAQGLKGKLLRERGAPPNPMDSLAGTGSIPAYGK